jgi:hypothetical protein
MSIYLTDAAQQEFAAEVKHQFQGAAILNNSTRVRRNVVGSIVNFRRLGTGIAKTKAIQDNVNPMGITHTNVACTLGNWHAADYSDIFAQAEVNYDEKVELAKSIALAMGRRSDQIIIDAIGTGASANVAAVPTSVGGAGTGLNLDKVLRLSKLLTDNGVPNDGKRHLLVNGRGLEQALLLSQFSSADYNAIRALMAGEINSFIGFQWHIIDNRTATGQEGGLGLASAGVRQGWAWHEESVGFGVGIDMKTEINYIAEKTSYLVNGVFKAGACVIDVKGVQGVQYTE